MKYVNIIHCKESRKIFIIAKGLAIFEHRSNLYLYFDTTFSHVM